MQTLLGGKYELSIGNTLIPASLLGDITPSFEEGMLEAETQAGTIRQPNGKADTAELTFTLYLESMDYLKVLWADAYNEPSGTQETGNIVFGSGSCSARQALPVNIHPVCEEDDNNDIHIFAGLVSMNFNPTISTGDALSVETTITMQPTENGYMRIGTGDLSKPSYWDVATQTTKPLSA